MNYTDTGLDKTLQRQIGTKIKPYTTDEVERLFTEIPGNKIVEYRSTKFNFSPSTREANPKEGHLYYDKTDKKFKFWNGTAYETISSA